MVQVHHDEGVANRIDPESCADAREGIGEALTGERIGQPLSRESTLILGADVVPVTEGNTDGRDNASAQTARRGLRHWHEDWTTWERIKRLADDWLPKPRILHPWPESRFAVRHPRWEPYARIGPVRICAGGAR